MENVDALDELLVCRLDQTRKPAEPFTLVIFGASGDLAARKLLPALYQLAAKRQLPASFRIFGFARREKNDDSWRSEMKEAVQKFSKTPVAEETWAEFAGHLHYFQGDLGDAQAYAQLRARILAPAAEPSRRNLLFYLAVQPSQFGEIGRQLHAAGLLGKTGGVGESRRLVVEKPFGQDLMSAKKLNQELVRIAHEKQVFRIDHYLGKETVQNILIFRFSNGIFEPLWNRQCIDHVQITLSEKLGVGTRGGFYEEAGALRDVVQNHLLEVLSLIAMEPPVSLDAESIRDEKVKVLRAIRPILPIQAAGNVVRGQYIEGVIDNQARVAYRQEAKVDPASNVETYVALRLLIDNWRWNGVPFYLRTGKSLALSASEVRIQFRPPPHVLFAAQCGPKLDANAITIRLQPDEGISLRFNGKIPGSSMQIRPVPMNFSYQGEFGAYTPEAYERLLLDAIVGDPTLFIRSDMVEAAWSIMDPIREAWQGCPLAASEFYRAGSWGPTAADELLGNHGHAWRNPVL